MAPILLASSKWAVLLFGAFIIAAGMLMLFAPVKARAMLRKAGSTNLINYSEITLRMIPAVGLILYADFAKYPGAFTAIGWFMLGTSILLYMVPRKIHHGFSLKSADLIKPLYFRLLSPVAVLFGLAMIYCVF